MNFELGEGETGRVGEWEKSSFSPRTSSPLASSLNIHPLNPLNPVHWFVAELPSDFCHLTFQIKQKASRCYISAPPNCILFCQTKLSRLLQLKKSGSRLASAAAAGCNQATQTESQTSHCHWFGNCFCAHCEVLEVCVVAVTAIVEGD